MIVALGTDHGGFALKDVLAAAVRNAGHQVIDCGATSLDPEDDYPDFTAAVARAVLGGKAERGIVVCGSGVGAAIAANKFRGIRCSLCHDTFSARQGVEDDSMNVLALGARIIGPSLAEELVKAFLHATFSNAARHRRRLEKVMELERNA